jgi:pimeloyl-ACP methyl ester carboxylesterase
MNYRTLIRNWALGMALFQLAACRTDDVTAPPVESDPLPGPAVPALSSPGGAFASVADAAVVTSTDPHVQALVGTTQPVRWYYIMSSVSQRWYIVEPRSQAVLQLDRVDQSANFGIYWRPVNRYAASSSPSTSAYPDAGNNFSVSLSPDGRTVNFGPALASNADVNVQALAGTSQPVRWFYVYNDPTGGWYIVSPVGRSVLLLHHVDQSTSFGIYWKPISNVVASGSASTSIFPDAGDNYPQLLISHDGQSISFGASTTTPVNVPPTVTLTATPDSIFQGGSSTLNWSSTGATSCSAPWTGSTATQGSAAVRPSSTTSYTITCVGAGGSSSSSASVKVLFAPTGTNVIATQAVHPDGRTKPVAIAQTDIRGTFDTTKRTWLVIHGRKNSPANMSQITDAIRSRMPTDQVLTLDWTDAADEGALDFGFDGENWIGPVARAAASVLEYAGFDPKLLNLVGHSWGSYVADEMAEAMGDVNLLIALDPPKNTWGSAVYKPTDYTTIDFFAHSTFSVAFHSSFWGSLDTSVLAHESFVVSFPSSFSITQQHSSITQLFGAMIRNDLTGAVSKMFSLSRLVTRTWGAWQQNRFSVDYDNDGMPPTQSVFEGIITSNSAGEAPDAIRFVNSGGRDTTIYENPVLLTPAISSVSPNPVIGANTAQPFTINGTNFSSGAIVRLRDLTNGGTFDKTPTSTSSTKLVISANFTAAATWSVQVLNPGGGNSNQLNFQVQAPVLTPSIASVNPNPVSGANAQQPFTVNGVNFVSGAIVRLRDHTNGGTFDKTPTSSSSTQLLISANFTTANATWSAQVINPGGTTSNQVTFLVLAPAAPSITGVNPNPVPGSNSSQPFTVNGTNFGNGAIVRLRDLTNGGTFDKTPVSSSGTKLVINANFTTAAATWTVQVLNPGGVISLQYQFTVR